MINTLPAEWGHVHIVLSAVVQCEWIELVKGETCMVLRVTLATGNTQRVIESHTIEKWRKVFGIGVPPTAAQVLDRDMMEEYKLNGYGCEPFGGYDG